MSFILAIDQGTSTTTAVIIDHNGLILSTASCEYPQYYPEAAYVEHRGPDIKNSVEQSVRQALTKANINGHQIAALGITNQRETIGFFDQHNNTPYPFIVWQCRRSQNICAQLKSRGLATIIHQRTGLHLDPYFSATKVTWMLERYPDLKSKLKNKELLLGTIDSFLAHWLSGGLLHISDITNASRTMLVDIKTGRYDRECLDIFGIPQTCLPEITRSTGPFANTKNLSFLPDGIPIAALAGDQQAALFGQTCFKSGDAKATFGTGCFILLNTGSQMVLSQHGLLTSIAYQIDEKPVYCLEGSAFIAGAAFQFLIDAFSFMKDPDELAALALSEPDSGGVVFVPALCGLGAPYWDALARGSLTGLSRSTTKGHIARATLEGVALQNTDIMLAMAADAFTPNLIKVDGGASANNLLMQMQADLLGVRCVRGESAQKTALGVAYMAGLAVGIFRNLEQISGFNHPQHTFTPKTDRTWATQTIERYRATLARKV